MADTLLLELLTEELPPCRLPQMRQAFAQALLEGLEREQFIVQRDYHEFATPRRLAIQVFGVREQSPQRERIKKGPSYFSAIKEGKPTAALTGFLKANHLSFEQLSLLKYDQQEVYAYVFTEEGALLKDRLQVIMEQAVKKIPVHKLMRWGEHSAQFVRPVHRVTALLGNKVIPLELFGKKSDRYIAGHRFLSGTACVELKTADEYEETLYTHKVVAGFDKRQQVIKAGLDSYGNWIGDQALLDEVTALVEWPVVMQGTFKQDYLNLPSECLILTMQKNQKYFPQYDKTGKLTHQFLLVSNVETTDNVIDGNERVLRARLEDAAFFYRTDLNIRLEDRVPLLKKVIYQQKLGSQWERIERLCKIAKAFAQEAGLKEEEITLTERSAFLCKADLTTQMVGEFPELQGVMGKYYALAEGEEKAVALAIEGHYYPRFAGDDLPQNNIGKMVALADKLEMLMGMWSVGFIPSGDKDPYALRRAALGVIRILGELDLDLPKLLSITADCFAPDQIGRNIVQKVYQFILERLNIYWQAQYAQEVVASALAMSPRYLHRLSKLLTAIEDFRQLPQAHSLLEMNKRVSHLLKKNTVGTGIVKVEDLQETAEKKLWQQFLTVKAESEQALERGDYQQSLRCLTSLKDHLADFFEQVMVMSDDPAVRANRLHLLAQLHYLFNQVCDLSYLM